MLHPNVFVFNFLLISDWVVAASLMSEKTNVGRQYLLQTSHLCVVSGRMELLPSFLRARLSAVAAISLSSPVLRCCFRALHFVRSVARLSQDIVSMSKTLISITQTFLYRRLGRPVVLLPNASSP